MRSRGMEVSYLPRDIEFQTKTVLLIKVGWRIKAGNPETTPLLIIPPHYLFYIPKIFLTLTSTSLRTNGVFLEPLFHVQCMSAVTTLWIMTHGRCPLARQLTQRAIEEATGTTATPGTPATIRTDCVQCDHVHSAACLQRRQR